MNKPITIPNTQLRQGMLVWENKKTPNIGKYNGTCEHGVHFGSECYDFIGQTTIVVSKDQA
jgi:hypothetical protein